MIRCDDALEASRRDRFQSPDRCRARARKLRLFLWLVLCFEPASQKPNPRLARVLRSLEWRPSLTRPPASDVLGRFPFKALTRETNEVPGQYRSRSVLSARDGPMDRPCPLLRAW